MLIIALVLAAIGLAALVFAVVTSNALVAWVCIGASLLGVLLLIVDALRERRANAPVDAIEAAEEEPEAPEAQEDSEAPENWEAPEDSADADEEVEVVTLGAAEAVGFDPGASDGSADEPAAHPAD